MLAQLGPSLGQAPTPPAHRGPSHALAPDPAASQDSCRGEVASLVQAMYRTFQKDLDAITVPGFESFGTLALALGQAGIYTGLLNIRLAVSGLLCCYGNLYPAFSAGVCESGKTRQVSDSIPLVSLNPKYGWTASFVAKILYFHRHICRAHRKNTLQITPIMCSVMQCIECIECYITDVSGICRVVQYTSNH